MSRANHAILTPEEHGDLRVRTERGAAYGDAVMCGLVVPDEFRQAQADYPILFRLDRERDTFSALALFGFEDGENLFLRDDGAWDAGYRPLAIDIQPFLIGAAPDRPDLRQVHIDLDSPRLCDERDEGVRLFDGTGRPTPYLDATSRRLGALDEGYRSSPEFFAALRRHDLLEPLSLEITLEDGATHSLVGFHAIDEERMRELDGDALAELHADGHLMPIFMTLASLAQLGALVERKNRRLSHG